MSVDRETKKDYPDLLKKSSRDPPSVFLNHHLGGLDDDANLVAFLQSQFFSAGASDNAFHQVLAHFDDDVSHDGADLDAFHCAGQLVTRRECHSLFVAKNGS